MAGIAAYEPAEGSNAGGHPDGTDDDDDDDDDGAP